MVVSDRDRRDAMVCNHQLGIFTFLSIVDVLLSIVILLVWAFANGREATDILDSAVLRRIRHLVDDRI